MFRDKVIEEAIAQRELRNQKRPIPPNLRRYARLAGIGVLLTSGLGSLLILVLAYYFGSLYCMVLLFLGVLGAMGFLQILTGRHLLSAR